MTCPKCGVGTMRGPRYIPGPITGHGRLQYTCATCGYDEDRPTKDAKTGVST